MFGLKRDRVDVGRFVGAYRLARVGGVSVVLVASLWGASAALASQPGVISGYAGTGSLGTPTPGPAINSALRGPYGVAVDSAGNVYIADSGNFEVEKVTPSGILSVIAGTGSPGTSTPGPATSSRLGGPRELAVDSAGNLYIADINDDEVEKVTPSGILSVIAGTGSPGTPTPGPATSSRLNAPYGVAVGSTGDLYIADEDNDEIEEVTPSGILSVIVGTGTSGPPTPGPATSSRLSYPRGLAVNAAGDLYIADLGNSEVEEVTPSGILSVVAGTGTSGTATPGPASSSALADPYGVAVDPAGNLFVADTFNNEIEEVTPSGILSVIAGSGSQGAPTYGGPATSSALKNPRAVALDSAGDLYIDDTNNNEIDVVSPAVPSNSGLPQVTGTPTAGRTLSASTGVWFPDPTGYAYEWQDCDSAGNNCTAVAGATAGTYTLTSADIGHTIRVLVTASNPSGAANSNSPPSGQVQAPTPTTPTTPTTPPVVTLGCPMPTGRLARRTLGSVRLGMTRAQSLRWDARSSTHDQRNKEFFCLTGGKVRVGYGSPRLLTSLPSVERHALHGRVVLALTANPYYALRGIRPGAGLRTAARTLHIRAAAIHVGLNEWYMAPDGTSTAVLKVRHGIVQEIGIANPRFTHTRRAQRSFITSFS